MKINKILMVLAMAAVLGGCGGTRLPLSPAPTISLAPQQSAATQAANSVDAAVKGVDQKAANIQAEAMAAATEPTTQAVQPHLTSIEADADALRGISVDLGHTSAQLRQLQTDIAATQKQIDQLRADYTTAQKAVATAQDAQAAAQKEAAKWQTTYNGSWLGGKSHRLITYITTGIILFFLVDGLLYIFTNFSLNPFTLIFSFGGKIIGTIIGWFRE